MISAQANRLATMTPVTARASKAAWRTPPSTPDMPRTALGIWTPTNAQSEPLISNVVRLFCQAGYGGGVGGGEHGTEDRRRV